MFREQSITNEASWASGDDGVVSAQEIDRALRRLASQRAALDADEACWLRAAEDQNAWRQLGYAHALEYLEDVFGYAPRTATERLRVARELGELRVLEDALRAGELSYSVVRELTRVATPVTEARWLDCARGKNLRQVEQMVSGKRKGSDPDDRPDPKLVKQGVWLDLDAESFAIWRQLRQVIEEEHGCKLDDKALVAALGHRVFAGGHGADNDNNSPAHMIHITTCGDCRRAWQDGGGVRVEVDPATLERAACDAVICDDKNGGRAKRSIPPITWRKVMERDERSCRVPGCRASRYLDVHHIVHRAHGGSNDPSNLIVLCRGHHKLHHDGMLTITGQAPDALVFARDGKPLGEAGVPAPHKPKAMLAKHASGRPAGGSDEAPRRAKDQTRRSRIDEPVVDERDIDSLATAALRQAGYKAATAKRAVEVARTLVEPTVSLAELIRVALQHCD